MRFLLWKENAVEIYVKFEERENKERWN